MIYPGTCALLLYFLSCYTVEYLSIYIYIYIDMDQDDQNGKFDELRFFRLKDAVTGTVVIRESQITL